jgi:DNA-binding response OmpR family regulator
MWRPSAGAKQVVLLVEDDQDLLEMTTYLLQRRGFAVLTAENAVDAVRICQTHDGDIDVLVTDVRLPGVSGGELARSAVALRPDLDVIYISGIPEETAVRLNLLKSGGRYIAKPFTGDCLADTVTTTLSIRDEARDWAHERAGGEAWDGAGPVS